MALTESQVVANEMEKVRDVVPTLFDRDDVFFSSVEKKDVERISSRDMRVPLELRPGGRFGAFDPDGGDLGRGDGPVFDKALVNTVHMRHAIEWTKKAEWATDDGRKAVIKTFQYLLSKAMSEFRRQVDSLCMTGGDGVVGTVSAVSTGSGKDTLTLGTDGWGARLLRYGQYLSVYNSGLTARRTNVGGASLNGEAPIDLYDLANKQVRLNGSSGATVATDKLVISGLTATPPTFLQGVAYHHSNASTGLWLGLDRALVPEIRANRVNAAGTLALPFARLAVNKIGDRVGADNIKKAVAWMHPCQKQAYEELGQLISVIQQQPKEQGLDLYFNDAMQMAGCPVKTSFSWDKTRIDFVVSDVWGRAEMHQAGFYEVDGRKIFEVRGSSGGIATSQEFYIVASFNMFVNNPAVCSYIDGLTVPSGY
jgi:hypothetical protein